MPKISITDGLDLQLELDPKLSGSITRYFKDPLSFTITNPANLKNLSLENAPVTSLLGALKLEQNIKIGSGKTEMTIAAGHSLDIKLFKETGEFLFPNHFGELSAIKVRENRPYLAFSISPTLSSGFSHNPGKLNFGFESGSTVTITNYKPFSITEDEPSFVDALGETIQDFVLPGDVQDLEAMSVGTIATVEGLVNLRFSAALGVPIVGNPLATVDAPDPVGTIRVKAGASVALDASFSLQSELQLRLHKLDENTIELGYYKKNGSKAEAEVTAVAGLSAGEDGKDFIGPLINALSSEPEVDVDELRKAGLSGETVADISAAISAGVNRRLELNLNAAFSFLEAGSAAFLYRVDMRQLDARGRQALHQALDGDLTGLVRSEETVLPGIDPIRSITKSFRNAGVTLKFNLLGIYNFISVSKLLAQGVVLYEHATGELVISDHVTAKRLDAGLNNLVVDRKRLRRLYAESFLFTAGYRGSALAGSGPSLDTRHSYFESLQRTDRETMKDNLDVAQALGLLEKAEKNEMLRHANFGRSTLYVETGYDDEILRGLFVDKEGNPLPMKTYEEAGRRALSLLVQDGERNSYRRPPALDDALWERMKTAGSMQGQRALFDLTEMQLNVVHSDYIVIMWWASAMRQMGERLAKTREFLGKNPDLDTENKDFTKVRSGLLKSLRSVAKATRSQFGDPWGLVAMDQLAQRAGRASVHITSQQVALNRKR